MLAVAAAGLLLAPRAARAQALQIAQLIEEPNLMMTKAGTPGYLGVDVADVDAERAQALRLKEVRGAVITLIDHDAPAGQIGLKVNDVVLAIDGQNIEGAEQLRRALREIPPGRKVSLVISRDGNIQTLAVQLVDRKAMERDIWSKIGIDVDGIAAPSPPPAMSIVGSDAPVSSGFHLSIFGSTLNVGALVEPLTSQMAEYFGVPGGLMIKQVARKSEAAAAGFKAFDVILKVGSESINTSADWDRALRSNQGKPVQVTVLRNKKQQVLTLQVDSRHRGAIEFDDLFPPNDAPLLAELAPGLDPGLAEALSAQAAADANAMAEAMRAQADALRRQMEEFRKSFSDRQMKQFQQQMEQFQRQMQQSCGQCTGNFV
jgi:membrane-associated protease RseP (regulator of RpoE activity)